MNQVESIVIILEGFVIILFAGTSLYYWIRSTFQTEIIKVLEDRISCVIDDIETDGHTQKGRDNAIAMLKGKRND